MRGKIVDAMLSFYAFMCDSFVIGAIWPAIDRRRAAHVHEFWISYNPYT